MESDIGKKVLEEYTKQNKAVFYKKVIFNANDHKIINFIYWADPKIAFYDVDDANMPVGCFRTNYFPESITNNIYIHEKLTKKYADVFEFVILHELGHCWHTYFLDNLEEFDKYEIEALADLFAAKFLIKFRNYKDIAHVNTLFNYLVML